MPLIRSLFFAPANRPDLVAKFPRFAADCYVIDLEDGTPPANKASARDGLAAARRRPAQAGPLPGVLTVRVNEPESDHYLDDLAAALASDVDGIVIPKLESVEQLFPALHRLRRLDRDAPRAEPRFIVGGLESIAGVANAAALCRADPSLAAVYFGAEDLASELGARRTPAPPRCCTRARRCCCTPRRRASSPSTRRWSRSATTSTSRPTPTPAATSATTARSACCRASSTSPTASSARATPSSTTRAA